MMKIRPGSTLLAESIAGIQQAAAHAKAADDNAAPQSPSVDKTSRVESAGTEANAGSGGESRERGEDEDRRQRRQKAAETAAQQDGQVIYDRSRTTRPAIQPAPGLGLDRYG